ncbi:2TM domain-containing protein [Legionella sp. W05-934-2]|jgi:cation transport ATPase|uniref:2TM domain-containing protein n=1 Tax=Legionella sp. W05-934-2 TaxID=1198649 RepID=UPI003461F5B5
MSSDEEKLAKEKKIAAKQARKLRSFYKSLLLFAMVNLLLLINHFLPTRYNNSYTWLLIIWAMFLIYQGISFFRGFWIFRDDWEERYVEKKLKK